MKNILLPKDYEYLSQTLENLSKESKVLTKKLGEAAAHGGAVPFQIPEYQAIDDKLKVLINKAGQIKKILSESKATPFEKINEKNIGLYSLVKVGDVDTEQSSNYYIIHPELADRIEFETDTLPVSPGSPVGQALIGKKPGNTVKIKLPKSKKTLKITSFEKKEY